MYLEDIKDIKEGTHEEEEVLLGKIAKGDQLAKNRYIEANLHYVVRLAAEYKNQGVTMEDLIQEGNIGLISALESAADLTESSQGKEIVTDFIRKSMEAAILDQKENSSFEKDVLKKINYIRDAADELAEDLGREATIHELSGYIKLTEKEITDILKMSGEGVKLEEDHDHTHKSHGHTGHEHPDH
jgi:RNA polymerase primary sigma factor